MRLRAMALGLLLSGCFAHQHGRDIDFAAVNRLKPGVSTRADAEALFGKPSAVTTPADGNTYVGWMYVHAQLYNSDKTGSKNLTLMFKPDSTYIGVAVMSASGADVAPAR